MLPSAPYILASSYLRTIHSVPVFMIYLTVWRRGMNTNLVFTAFTSRWTLQLASIKSFCLPLNDIQVFSREIYIISSYQKLAFLTQFLSLFLSFLLAYYTAKMKSNDNKASPCFKSFINLSNHQLVLMYFGHTSMKYVSNSIRATEFYLFVTSKHVVYMWKITHNNNKISCVDGKCNLLLIIQSFLVVLPATAHPVNRRSSPHQRFEPPTAYLLNQKRLNVGALTIWLPCQVNQHWYSCEQKCLPLGARLSSGSEVRTLKLVLKGLHRLSQAISLPYISCQGT
jgi:hypothetical protein